jgi:methyltransferase-like protein
VGTLTDDPRREVIEREQYLDFFKNRMFRQTLLCHGEAPVVRALDDRRLEHLQISSSVQTGQENHQGLELVTLDGFSVTTSEPLVIAAMRALAEGWPATLSFSELLEHALAASPGASAEAVAARLRAVLLEAYLARVVQLHGAAPAVSPRPEEQPLAGALTRAQARQGSAVVSSMLHTNIRLESDLEAEVLALLDGTRGLDALGTALSQPTAAVQSVLERFASVGLLRKS